MDHRVIALVVIVLAVFCAGDAATVVEKLKTRVRAPPVASMPSSNSMSSLAAGSMGSAGSIGSVGVAPVASEAGSVESIAATKLIGEGSCAESSTSCSGAIRWGDASSSSSSNSNSDGGDLPPVDDVVGPIAAWIKAFKKRIGNSDNLAEAAHAIVQPLIEKLKRNQKTAEEKLEESNQAILDSVEKSVTDHVLKLLRAEKITEHKAEQSEVRQAKVEAARDEQSERELRGEHSMESLSASIASAVSELSASPQSKSVLEHVSQELAKAKQS